VRQLAGFLKHDLGAAARKVPTRALPSWLLRVIALFDPQVRGVLPELGKHKNALNAKARRLLSWQPRSVRESALATARSLLELKLVKAA
jgi:dihydroflavonol-4-reductase